jgi:hypothetical protein
LNVYGPLIRIALFSDVHANLPALEAVLDDIGALRVDARFVLGDLVGYAPWPNEVLERLQAVGLPVVMALLTQSPAPSARPRSTSSERARISRRSTNGHGLATRMPRALPQSGGDRFADRRSLRSRVERINFVGTGRRVR